MEEKRPFVEWLRYCSEQDRQRYEADRYKWFKFAAKWREKDQWVRDFTESDPNDLVAKAISKLLSSSQAAREVEHSHFNRLVYQSIKWKKKDVLDELIKKEKDIVNEALEEVEGKIQESHPDPLDTLIFNDFFAQFKKLLKALGKEKLVEIVDLYYLQGETGIEIAEKLGLSNATISRYITEMESLKTKFAKNEGF